MYPECMSPQVTPIREQTRAVVRSLLARTALEIFAAQGYDSTTVDQVAAAAGVSRRTLFNYFRTKEDLALSSLSEQGELIAERFVQRPAGEGVWESLRAAFGVLEEIDMPVEERLRIATLLFDNESLRAGHAEKQARWQDLLAPMIEPRLPASEHRSLEARAIAAAAITCLQAASEEWVRQRGGDLTTFYDAAVGAVRHAE